MMASLPVCLVLLATSVSAQTDSCYGAGSVTGAAIGCFIAGALVAAGAFYVYMLVKRARNGKHLVFTTDPESVKDEFAFDNPGFRQEEKTWQHDAPTLPLGMQKTAKPDMPRDGQKTDVQRDRNPFNGITKTNPLFAEFTQGDSITGSKDDLALNKARVRVVRLWARDFTGLGLRYAGDARSGLRVASVLRNGPAAAASVHPGDRIKSVKVELTGCPLQDAVGILSLASPYPVELELEEGGGVGAALGVEAIHPVLRRAGSMGDVAELEQQAKTLYPPKSPEASHSNNSTLEQKPKGIKKMITEITTTLERTKKEKNHTSLERENEKNKKQRHSDIPTVPKEKQKSRHSSAEARHLENESPIQAHVEKNEVQKRENDAKRGMKFGIRVLPPNVPDDGVLRQKSFENGTVAVDTATDQLDSPKTETKIDMRIVEIDRKPIVAKRRDKTAPPVPTVRTFINESSMSDSNSFTRDDLNSSGIKRDENGIPQELPQHMLEAAMAARVNRKNDPDKYNDQIKSRDLREDVKVRDIKDMKVKDDKKEDNKQKKSKGKAPSPPERNKSDDSIIEQLKNVNEFLDSEKMHSSNLHQSYYLQATDKSLDMGINKQNTSTPKAKKIKDESMNFSQDDIDDIVSKPFKRESDSLNNYFEDSKSNMSSTHDVHSVSNQSEVSTTIELNNSDITIHSSPQDASTNSVLDENERKAASLGDLSRFENKMSLKPSTGTLERAQSLDISDDVDLKDNLISPKKRKANSVVEATFFDSSTVDVLHENMALEKGNILKSKEPRLSLNIAKTSAMDGLSNFQKNRLKKASEFGTLEDAIVKDLDLSLDSESLEKIPEHETSDHLASRLIDENAKVNFRLVSDFAKATEKEEPGLYTAKPVTSDFSSMTYDEKLTYDTNIPDDLKVSRHTLVSSLERPKSDMMKKLLAKNPALNVHIDGAQTQNKTDSLKTQNHPDEVTQDVDDFVSNIRVGSNNNSLNFEKKPTFGTFQTNVTVKPDDRDHTMNKFTKSIEISDSQNAENVSQHSNLIKTSHKQPQNITMFMTQEPVQKTVTVNVSEDDLGNKVITQNVETIATEYIHSKLEAPLQIEQVTFGITRKADDLAKLTDENDSGVNANILEEIRKQNPNMHFTNTEPTFTKTETIILKTDLEESEALKLMDKLKNDPNFMADKTPEELSQMGVRVIRELDDETVDTPDVTEVIKTRYAISPTPNNQNIECTQNKFDIQNDRIRPPKSFNANKHVTEIEVLTPRTEKLKHKTEKMTEIDVLSHKHEKPKDASEIAVSTPNSEKQRNKNEIPNYTEPELSYELDISLLDDFIANEKRHSSKELVDLNRKNKSNDEKRNHPDFDLPRNSHIKFRTGTYESPKGTIVTSTDLETKMRHSEAERVVSPKPNVSAKPSSIPVKTVDKSPKSVATQSKIPVFMSQKSQSQENLTEKTLSFPRSHSNLSNISLTSIKSSSRNPSGKL